MKTEQITTEKAQQAKLAEDLKAAPLDRALKGEQIKTEQAQRTKIFSDIKKATQEINDGKPLTAEQSKALGYGSRLVQSNDIINDIGDQFATKPAFNLSVFGKSLVPGFLKSGAQKQFEQAKKNFINSVLRRESGAAISPSEFENAEDQYFPKLGDDKGTLGQKQANRFLVTGNFLKEGGMKNVDPRKLKVAPSGELIEITN